MIKKIINLLILFTFCISLTSCGGRFRDFSHKERCPECSLTCSCVRCINVSKTCPFHPWLTETKDQKKVKQEKEVKTSDTATKDKKTKRNRR